VRRLVRLLLVRPVLVLLVWPLIVARAGRPLCSGVMLYLRGVWWLSGVWWGCGMLRRARTISAMISLVVRWRCVTMRRLGATLLLGATLFRMTRLRVSRLDTA
jgi:hypothetical protein